MTRLPPALLCALVAACASGASGPPVTEPGAPPPTTAAPPPPEESSTQPGNPPDDGGGLDTDAEAAGVRRLWRSSRSGIESAERLVIRDQAELAGVWERLGAEDSSPPRVDWERKLVVVAAAGQRPTGGHSVSVGRAVVEDDGVLVVEVITTAPARECPTTQALTQPVDVVAVESEGVAKWRFVEREEAGSCGGE
jgi:PrcB C-terminal